MWRGRTAAAAAGGGSKKKANGQLLGGMSSPGRSTAGSRSSWRACRRESGGRAVLSVIILNIARMGFRGAVVRVIFHTTRAYPTAMTTRPIQGSRI